MNNIQVLYPERWKQYELIDCGNFEKLERFGEYVTIRPEPQALWDKTLSEKEWNNIADIRFEQLNASSGNWIKKHPTTDQWHIAYPLFKHTLQFKLALTAFKHIGIFPEQATNWDFIYNKIKNINSTQQPTVLNLFAYTGGASLAAKAAGADVVHLDSIKQVVSWAKNNQILSGLSDIRWIIEDARKFVQREAKRGKKYTGIVLDPPAYGLGPAGERWKLEDHIYTLLKEVRQILHNDGFLVLNTYSLGFSALITQNMLDLLFNDFFQKNVAELALKSKTGLTLPLGVIGRCG